jgi:ferritin-like metal-binding protein YciE
MKGNLLHKLYVDELRDLYSAETQLTKALPKMAKAATSEDLRAGFEGHLEQTREHVSRLEQIFEALQMSPKGKHCVGMEGLIKEGGELIEEGPAPEQLDAGLIAAAQRVEHYEMAAYGSVRTFANLLGESDAEALLEKTLSEEKETDAKLTELSETINVEAMEAESDETEARESARTSGKPAAKRLKRSA